MVISTLTGHAQLVNNNGCVGGDFGINAWLYSGQTQTSGFIPPAGSVDWFQGPTGRNVINETSPATIQTLLQSQFNPTYERRMNGSLSSIADVSGTTYKILIDAVFARDMFGGTGGIDNTSYNTASKNGEDPSIWDPGPQNVLGKVDLIDVAGHMFRDIDTATSKNDLWFTGIINRAEPGGDAYMDFEFFVAEVSYTPGSGFTSGGPQIGHTALTFDAGGNITKIGDILFNVSLTGGGTITGVQTRIWVSLADRLSITPVTFDWGTEYDGAFNGSPYVYASIVPKQAGLICGYVNAENQNPTAPPWGTLNTKYNAYGTTYSDYSVAEMGINLTALGLDHASLSGANPCYFPLNTFMIKTRASASFTAQLKDFSGPYSWGQPGVYISPLVPGLLSCQNPQITLTAQPVRNDITYSWSTIDGHIVGSSTTAAIVVDRAGTYNVQVTLPTNCPVQSNSVTVNLDPTKPFFTSANTTATVSCNGNDGTVNLTVVGGTAPYSYSWTKDGSPFAPTTEDLTGLAPGTYLATVTDVWGCQFTSQAAIVLPRTTATVSNVITPVTCFGLSNGAINITPTAGNAPFTYLWSNSQTSEDIINIAAGSYSLTLRDADGCNTVFPYTVTQPALLNATYVKTDDTDPNPVVANGTITLTVSGGTAPYTYNWTKNGVAFDTTQNLTGLARGTYAVLITDSNGCTTTLTIPIWEPEICNDGIDNDGNGLSDCNDSPCIPAAPSAITPGNTVPCILTNVTYTVTAVSGLTYDWTVPANANIISGQGTNTITVQWTTTTPGQVCVKANNVGCLSSPTCYTATPKETPPAVGNIIKN